MRHSPSDPPSPEPDDLPPDEAFKALYEATVGPVTAWLFRFGVADREWRDAIQEIYLEAWRSWSTFDSERGKREQWLYGITINVAGRFRKRHRSRARWEAPEPDSLDIAHSDGTAEDYVQFNDRARFTAQFFKPVDTVPLAILIAHDMNGEHMKEIAARHGISLSEAYRLRDQATYVFTEGYEKEQAQRRKTGAAVLPVAALSLLLGPHPMPDFSPDAKADIWAGIEQKIGAWPGPSGNQPPAHAPKPAASLPAAADPRPTTPTHGTVARGLRGALAAHPIAGPALLFTLGAIVGVFGDRLLAGLDRGARSPVAQEASAPVRSGEPGAAVTSVASAAEPPPAAPRAPDSADARVELAPAGQLTPAEAAQFDIVRAAFASGDTENALSAIQAYLKAFPRGHFAADCEKMRIQTLIRGGRLQEARDSIARLRKRSPKSPLLKELESTLPGP